MLLSSILPLNLRINELGPFFKFCMSVSCTSIMTAVGWIRLIRVIARRWFWLIFLLTTSFSYNFPYNFLSPNSWIWWWRLIIWRIIWWRIRVWLYFQFVIFTILCWNWFWSSQNINRFWSSRNIINIFAFLDFCFLFNYSSRT